MFEGAFKVLRSIHSVDQFTCDSLLGRSSFLNPVHLVVESGKLKNMSNFPKASEVPVTNENSSPLDWTAPPFKHLG